MASKRVLAALGLAGALFLVATATTLAAGSLDQQVTTSDQSHSVSSVIRPAQVFTAGITGNLDQVDLQVTTGFEPGGPSDALTVQIWTTTSGAPASPIAGATATVLAAAVPPGSPLWVHVPISAPSVAGTQYAIVLSSPGSSGGTCPEVCWAWLADDSNPYGGGLSFYSLNGGGWVAQARDLDFKTYVTPQVNVQIYLSGVGDGANGSVTSSPAGLDCGATCLAAFDVGSKVTLTAHPVVTATFGYWQGGPCDQSHNPVCTFNVPSANVETNATFYGIEATIPPPTPGPTATHGATPRPTVRASAGASGAPASVEPSIEASGEPAPTDTAAASLAPGATPAPTTVPAEPAAGDGSSSAPLLLGGLLLLALIGGGAYLLRRRRQPGAPPPEAGAPPDAS